MDKTRQHNWLSITAYVLSSLAILAILFFFAETYFPSPSGLIPRQPDPITNKIFNIRLWQSPNRSDGVAETDLQEKLFFRINRKVVAGKSELIYRGLVGQAEFQIDVIIPELDPQVCYPYRLKISRAKKSFRLVNRDFKLISARKHTLQLKQIK